LFFFQPDIFFSRTSCRTWSYRYAGNRCVRRKSVWKFDRWRRYSL